MRLDLLGNMLLLGIGLYASGQRFALDPAKIGVVLSYSISSACDPLITVLAPR
jgi:ATP-binding cassette subfamily C (CFTR/MRP) protein 1